MQAPVSPVLSGHGDFANPAKRSEAVIWEPACSPEKAEECLKNINSQVPTRSTESESHESQNLRYKRAIKAITMLLGSQRDDPLV